MRRALVIAGLVAAAGLAVIIYTFVNSLDSLVKSAIETYGSAATGTRVTLTGAKVRPRSAEIQLQGLSVGNPAGFESEYLLRLEKAVASMDVSTITSEPVVIDRILVSEPHLVYELGPDGSNLAALKRNIERARRREPPPAQDRQTAEKPSSGTASKLVIEEILVKEGKVAIRSTLLEGREISVSLPDLRITGIGKDRGGATPEAVAAEIAAALVKGVAAATRKASLEKALGKGGEELEQAARIIDRIHEGAGEEAREAADILRRRAKEGLEKLLR